MPTQCPAEMFENLAQFIATAPVEIQAAFELNERVYAATLEGVLKEKRRNLALEESLQLMMAFANLKYGNQDEDFNRAFEAARELIASN